MAGHSHALFVHGASRVHRLAPETKIAGTVLFVLAVVVTPRESMWAFAIATVLVLGVAAVAHVPLRHLATRVVLELPFLAFALFLPFVGGSDGGDRTDVFGLSLSVEGLWAGWNIVVKGTLGVLAAVVLAATTEVPALLRGLERLHLPRILVQIAGFMVRYLEVVGAELSRMRIARESRGSSPRVLWHAGAVARTGGALFIRTYERGERVHTAMLARGYDGRLPMVDERAASHTEWRVALAVPGAMVAVTMLALVLS
jgi:cobalt/nickel transport system permease protein